MKTVISVQNISKSYQLGQIDTGTFSNDLKVWWSRMRGKPNPLLRIGDTDHGNRVGEELWALRDVSFQVEQGEVLGIIGRNGAGKSTLLKILSRITAPTSGTLKVKGRISSLLEVGTGFHPELTGRENVFLNGAILGMTKNDIARKFEEIVDFSEIGEFIDTPVKRYSSGMYVRLAFSVASHLESELLVIDEVLAVGDTVFQNKCVEKMLEVSKHGRTILFVSHNLAAIKSLCSRGMVLRKGKNIFSGGVEESIEKYLDNMSLSGKEIDLSNIVRNGTVNEITFEKITFLDYPMNFGKPIKIKVKLNSKIKSHSFSNLDFGIAIQDKNLNSIIHVSNRYLGYRIDHMADEDEYLFEIENILKPGVYSLILFLRSNNEIQDWINNVVRIEITDGNPYNFFETQQIQGVILPMFNFSVLRNSN
jgi:lipopolysaccharide transport system ATP-binding protein